MTHHTIHPTVAVLTLEEKATLVSGASFWNTEDVERVGIRGALMTDGPHGVRLQRTSADNLGIFDSEPATGFPTACATASTWDPELLEAMGEALGRESRALGVDVLLGPGVNMKRSPLCGRNFEYFSEDPFLAGRMAAGLVRGIQSTGTGASVKHFAANNQEKDRFRVSANVDERTLREIYLPAFEHVVTETQPATVMCAYNRLNGVYASQHRWLLTEVLRDEWGFEGYVVSDWGAVVDPVAAVAAGLDLEMPSPGEASATRIVAAVNDGTLDVSLLDLAVSRILTVHDRLRETQAETTPDFDAHHALARRIAADSTVMLANDGDLLPLDAAAGGAIALVGEFAREPRFQGAGSSFINPTRLDRAVDTIAEATSREVVFAPGYRIDGTPDAKLVREAVAAAERAEAVVLFLGLPAKWESEGFDREHMHLPADQVALLEALAAVNPSIIVVLSNGGVVTLDGVAGRAPAILETWLSGQAGASAVADIVFGAAEPGGRLAETIPFRLEHNPAHLNWAGTGLEVNYGERVYIGYRWYDATDRDVAYPFGHGLGYTTFRYDDLAVTVQDPAVAEAIVEVSVTNVGERAGAEVVQAYVGDPESAVDRPVRELKGFAKVRLEPGETARVRIELDRRAFAYWGERGWTVDPGAFLVEVGASSRDIRASQRIVLDVVPVVASLRPDSSLREWLDHPVGGPVIRAAFEAMGPMGEAFTSEEMLAMMADTPISNLMKFGGNTDVEGAVAALLSQVEEASVTA
ncbi:glycoside hydrolase family 3 C-terminal domain-containing protein [Demequina pelophila]|uniref:glycoside hydrolase family 3 C-terminal domain-containing protein n=1 Tax=Demequina pelophila TaxID=1638984 RepID=UPI000785A633|nr:glycoside hydrolase family 3 C-terminal domain-containing protein [Demequina pelophila]